MKIFCYNYTNEWAVRPLTDTFDIGPHLRVECERIERSVKVPIGVPMDRSDERDYRYE